MLGKFSVGASKASVTKTKQPIVDSCCSEGLPMYVGKSWVVDNDVVFYPNAPLEDEAGICHIMGPGNIHLYFCHLTGGTVEVESPLEFLRSSYKDVDEARTKTISLLKVESSDFPTIVMKKRYVKDEG